MRGRQRGCGRGIIPARAGFTRGRRRPSNSPPDHPRSRGVYGHRRAHRILCAGSSPLARGLRMGGGALGPAPRIIPARAGFTARVTCAPASARDHPRSRGVYMPSRAGSVSCLGSSPLARGLRSRDDWIETILVDHPRSRGVYIEFSRTLPKWKGSSPLARGLRPTNSWSASTVWIIPARAGFTRRRTGRRSPRPGSSPLARGLRQVVLQGHRHGRIIPARAGFTGPPGHRAVRRRDHPRSRGVYMVARRMPSKAVGSSPLARGLPEGMTSAGMDAGSSPLARGLHAPRGGGLVAAGIIPARAGFTAGRGRGRRTPRDHPRSRGVYWPGIPTRGRRCGSSPLARGLQGTDHAPVIEHRIIPARAGFT